MKANTGSIGNNALQMKAKKPFQSRRYDDTRYNEQQTLVMRGVQSAQRWSESRAAHIEELRAQVQAGTYKVDGIALAQRMFANQTHFLDLSWD